MKYANLHLHTVYSDGVLTPAQICKKVKEMGYGAVALSDHFTVSGYKELVSAAEENGLEHLLAMEIDGEAFGELLHIVAYDFDPTYPAMAKYIQNNCDANYQIIKAKFDKMAKNPAFGGLTWQDVLDNSPSDCWMNNEHIFALLVKRGIMEEKDYYSVFRPMFVEAEVEQTRYPAFRAEDTIKLIRNAGGVAGLAHPHLLTQHLPELYQMGIRAVEYDHPDLDKYDAAEACAFAASRKDVYLCGGTDHTGKLSNFPELRGDPAPLYPPFTMSLSTDVRCGVTKEEFDMLKNRALG